MERILFLFFFTIISILLDFYFYQIIKKYRIISWTKPIFFVYWLFTLITITNFFIYAFSYDLGFYLKAIIFSMIIGNFISKLVALPFLLIDDLRRMIIYFFRKRTESTNNKISRSKFLSISASLAYGLSLIHI